MEQAKQGPSIFHEKGHLSVNVMSPSSLHQFNNTVCVKEIVGSFLYKTPLGFLL